MRIIVIILIGVALFLLLVWARKPWIFNVLMLCGAGLGIFMSDAAFDIIDTYWHDGPGIIEYHDDDRGKDYVEKVSEREYKRHHYGQSGVILVLGALFWVGIADWAKNTYLKKKTEPSEDE